MGCLFALLCALSSFTVALMPRSNLSHGCTAFCQVKKTKARGSHAASYTLFAHLSVRCTCGSSICSHLPPIGGGGGGMKQPYPFLSKSFHAAFVQKRCRSIRAREVPRGMQSCTEPPYTAELRKERGERERDGQRCKRKGKDTRSHPTHSDCHCHVT